MGAFKTALVETARSIPGARTSVKVARAVMDPDRILGMPARYNDGYLATNHWLTTDDRFEAAYRRAMDNGLSNGTNIKWRTHVACWAASNGAKLGGAFVECGVNRGFLSRVIIDYLGATPPFYLLDTYDGLDERYLSEVQIAGIHAWERDHGRPLYAECHEAVLRTFSDAPQVRIIRGAVPDTLPQVDAPRIAYLSLDMNCAIPEIEAIKYFWPRMAPGAYVVLDDYGWQGHEEQRHAFDEWSRHNGVPLLSLPTGQGLLVKT